MLVRALQALILVLVAVAGMEIGSLWVGEREAPGADIDPLLLCPAEPPALAELEPPPPAPAPEPALRPSAPPRHRGHPGTRGGPGPDALAECARNGGPLCGIPDR